MGIRSLMDGMFGGGLAGGPPTSEAQSHQLDAARVAVATHTALSQYANNTAQYNQTTQTTSRRIVRTYEPRFRVRRIRNGFILGHAKHEGDTLAEDFCENLEELGKRVMAIMVQYELEGDE